MTDDLIEVMAKALVTSSTETGGSILTNDERRSAIASANLVSEVQAKRVLTALESAGYVVGRMRWEDRSLMVGPLCGAAVLNSTNLSTGLTRFMTNVTGYERFDSIPEAKAAAESAVRKAMRGE